MNKNAAEQLISGLYEHCLNREPGAIEFDQWVDAIVVNGMTPDSVIRAFYESVEYQTKHSVITVFPPGHFHSPVVDPSTVQNYVRRERLFKAYDINNISLNLEKMRELWNKHLTFIKNTPFTDNPSSKNRYHYLGGPFPYGDAITLRMMIMHFRPQRVIEIGSGFSSACILDSAEHADLHNFHLTCIEPNAERLRSLLRPADSEKLRLIETPVQDVKCEIVDILEPNDILFIDSTHVMKTGSDVHYVFFHLMPRINPGVILHFHDIMYPFEYPDLWIFETNYSWNEAYALRAFLMFNQEFRIIFWNSLYATNFAAEINTEFPTFLKNPGGSIWIQRVPIQ